MSANPSARMQFLQLEIPGIASFLSEFRLRDTRERPEIQIGNANWEFLRIRRFPLPDQYARDYDDIVIDVIDYPRFPPAGFHAPAASPNVAEMQRSMGGHHILTYSMLPPNYTSRVEEFPQHIWICFRFRDWRWDFNPRDVQAGDSLQKYIEALYASLSGSFLR